jgi:hypothetical protein
MVRAKVVGVLVLCALLLGITASVVHAEQGWHYMTWEGPCGDTCAARYIQVGEEFIVEYWCCGQHGWTGGYAS